MIEKGGKKRGEGEIKIRHTSTTLPRNDDRLILVVLCHGRVRGIGDGKDVRGQRSPLLPEVLAHHVGKVEGKELVGVHGDEDGARVGVDLLLVVPDF